jgi:hypothetical protein
MKGKKNNLMLARINLTNDQGKMTSEVKLHNKPV